MSLDAARFVHEKRGAPRWYEAIDTPEAKCFPPLFKTLAVSASEPVVNTEKNHSGQIVS